jgi:hypothetical protein
MRGRWNKKRTFGTSPLDGTCHGCDRDMGGPGVEKYKDSNGRWWHKACWAREHE